MNRHGFKSWVFDRIEAQRKLTVAAAIGMATIGLVLFYVEARLIYLVFSVAYSRTTGLLTVIGVFGVTGLYSWKLAKKELSDRLHNTLYNGRNVTLNVVPPTSVVWSWAFGSMDTDRSFLEKLSGVLSIVPRLFCATWHTWRRVEAVRNIDSETTLTVMKMLFRSDHSVAAESIADGLGDVDLNKVLRDVSLLDGIVFLTRDGISLSIAPRLNEDFEAGRSVGRKHSDNEGLFSR